jgi:hypothetical protein
LTYNTQMRVSNGSNKLQLDLSNLNTGSYVVQMVIGNSIYSSKIIVK